MHFKKLELFGFKSFPEKTELILEPGITAIVGPNGCGKSNIADAIRWVLGEQSALALRGTRMEDVIFNGTAGRKSLGIAEVSLTMSNPENFLPLEYSEVTVTRRVFRSGESEYFINRSSCRLRDIKELFMDTGIGTDAYSLLEQGKIDLVLSTKPEDRRYLFEEAAGITKYKQRKKMALRKLEATEGNLLRVSDIVSEIKRQIGSLKRQVRKAERYREFFETLKDLEIKLAMSEQDKLKKQEELASEEAKKMQAQREELSVQVNKGDSRTEELRTKLLDLEKFLIEKQEESKELTSKINNSESRILLLRERRENLSRDKKRSQSEKESLEKKLSELNEEIKERELQLEKLSEERKERGEILTQKEKLQEGVSRNIESQEKEIEESKSAVLEMASRESKVKNDLTALRVTLENLSARKRRLKVEETRETTEKQSVEEKFKEISGKLTEEKVLLAGMEKEQEKFKIELNSLTSHLSILRAELSAERNELLSSSSRLKFLQDLRERYEGYQTGVKAILQNQEKFPEVCGTIADLIDFPIELERALEAVLGENVQSMVMKTSRAAEEAILYLSSENKGRATFLPLDLMKNTDCLFGEEILAQEGVLGLASSLVDFDPLYKNIFSCLLGNIIIVKDLDRAREIARILNAKNGVMVNWSVVTLKGETISYQGIIGGGGRDKDAGLLGRDKEIKILTEAVGSLKDAVSGKETEEKIGIQTIEKINAELQVLEQKMRQQELVRANLENDCGVIEEENIKRERELTLLGSELEEVKEDEEISSKEQKNLSQELEVLSQKSQEAHEKILSLQEIIIKERSEQKELAGELTKWQVELASWKEKERSAKNNLERIRESYKEYTDSLKNRQAEIEARDQQKVEITNEEKEKEAGLKVLFEEKDLLESELKSSESKRQDILSAISETEKTLKEKRIRLEEVQEKAHDLDLRLTQLEMNITSTKEKMLSEYKLSLEKLFKERQVEEINKVEVSGEIERLKEKLESMGTVNLVAIEENKELEERYNFLVEQQEDLVQAKESLQKVITKINRTTRSRFMETFEQVRGHFNELYRVLFGGGRADLKLVDEHDILETGIDIIAQPPGKKLQGISLLSGGERALTAIALLFALFKVKPSPFCLLDEMDAPLDESNISRFTKLLKDFTSQSQFIIITHNKKTIAMADIMYGITMEEAGVSKVISMRFRKEEKERKEADVKSL